MRLLNISHVYLTRVVSDGITNTFEDTKKDWQTNTYTLDYYRSRMGGIVIANPK